MARSVLVVLLLASLGIPQIISFFSGSYFQDFGVHGFKYLRFELKYRNLFCHSATYSYTCDPDYYPVFTV